MTTKDKKLTVKEKIFVKEYVKNKGNGTQAALVAYDTDNDKTASVIAAENLAKPRIRDVVDQALKSLDITPEKILKRFDTEADTADNAMARIRANENLADIADMYPKSSNSLDIGDGHIKFSWDS